MSDRWGPSVDCCICGQAQSQIDIVTGCANCDGAVCRKCECRIDNDICPECRKKVKNG